MIPLFYTHVFLSRKHYKTLHRTCHQQQR